MGSPPRFRRRPVFGRRIGVLLVSAALAFGLALATAASAVAVTYPSFTFVGYGWGHGIGMSQWGAKGFAERGK
ncbi:MAG: stage II sporulation protein D, partial [Coriobacteriia bacterium]|nr:stage II sporulation protein D [Coriobacteriia bacterium]